MDTIEKKKRQEIQPNGKALIPFLVFIVIYLGVGIVLEFSGVEMAFYQMPAPVAVLIGVALAFVMFKGSIDEKSDQFMA